MPNYYTIQEFANLKKTTRQTIYSAIKRNELEVTELYGKSLIKKTQSNEQWRVKVNMQRVSKKQKNIRQKTNNQKYTLITNLENYLKELNPKDQKSSIEKIKKMTDDIKLFLSELEQWKKEHNII